MSDEIKQTAQRVVDRLLNDDYASQEDFEKRPGGPQDPWRQSTVKLKFKKGEFSGKRGGDPGIKPIAPSPGGVKYKKKKGEGEEDEDGGQAKSRFDLKFDECRSAEGSAGKAWKKGKKHSGKLVAGKPGKVGYREALVASVLEKLAVKKAMKQGKRMKGKMVAGKPGKISYHRFAEARSWEDFWRATKQDALSEPADKEFLDVLRYYFDASGVTVFRGLSNEQFLQRITAMPDAKWAELGNQMTSLRDQYERAGESDEADRPERERGPGQGFERDRPPHVESLAKKRGMKAKRMLNAIAKAPGKVGFGKK